MVRGLTEKRDRNYRNKFRFVKSSYDTSKVAHLELGDQLACGQTLSSKLFPIDDEWPKTPGNSLCVDCQIAVNRLEQLVGCDGVTNIVNTAHSHEL